MEVGKSNFEQLVAMPQASAGNATATPQKTSEDAPQMAAQPTSDQFVAKKKKVNKGLLAMVGAAAIGLAVYLTTKNKNAAQNVAESGAKHSDDAIQEATSSVAEEVEKVTDKVEEAVTAAGEKIGEVTDTISKSLKKKLKLCKASDFKGGILVGKQFKIKKVADEAAGNVVEAATNAATKA